MADITEDHSRPDVVPDITGERHVRVSSSGDSNRQRMLADLREGLQLYWFWTSLAWMELLQRYRGSLLGPFWLTLTTAIFIVGLGPLYASLFGLNMRDYLPFMGMGIILWNFLLATFNESSRAFIDSSNTIKQINLPKSSYIFLVVSRNFIVFLHNIPIIIALGIYAGVRPDMYMLFALLGLALVAYNLFWIGLILAIICARFRDVVQIVASILLLSFFLTPIMWNPSLHRVPLWVVAFNPLAAYIELVRAPLLNQAYSIPLLANALAMSVLVTVAGMWLFKRYRKHIVYWV